MYKFNNNNIVTGQIKELLNSFNLPQIHALIPEITVFPNSHYIYKNKIYSFTGTSAEKLSADLNNLPSTLKPTLNYLYNQRLLNLTKNLEISNIAYDSYTHEYLGNYLRFHRDYTGIDLMSMYNCFSNRVPEFLNITNNIFSFNTEDNSYKIFAVPVNFFRDYTIGIDCDTSIEMFAGFYSEGEVFFSDEISRGDFYEKTYIKKVGTKLKKPFVYNILSNLSDLTSEQYNLEKHLVLYIKIPFSCKSSVVVLEGNFTSSSEHYFENGLEKLSNTPLFYNHNGEEATQYSYVTKNQLLYINSNVSHPFADRLVEYLFKNVVDSSDEISENIKRVQNILLKTDVGDKLIGAIKYGEWNEDIREVIYQNEISLGLIHKTFDSIGFYDKDIEEMLGE
jgi:hypothetical protein